MNRKIVLVAGFMLVSGITIAGIREVVSNTPAVTEETVEPTVTEETFIHKEYNVSVNRQAPMQEAQRTVKREVKDIEKVTEVENTVSEDIIEPTPAPVYEYEAVVKPNAEIMIVGDSRAVGMQTCVQDNGNIWWVCECSKGYDWLVNGQKDGDGGYIALPDADIRAFLSEPADKTLYFMLGVNDTGNVNRYVSYLNGLKAEFPEADIRYVTVNPIEDTTAVANGYIWVGNEAVIGFNAKVRETLSADIPIINTFDYLMANGYSTRDGIHYTNETYRMIYQYIMGGKEDG